MQQSAPTAAVQPQPQQQGGQAGQGGANYPMASLYVGDLGKYNIIFYQLEKRRFLFPYNFGLEKYLALIFYFLVFRHVVDMMFPITNSTT